MSTDLVLHAPQAVTLSNDQLQYIASTEFVPVGLRGNLPAILACVATGRALGLPDMTALRSIHIIEGKATFSAELMVMLVRREGHSIVGEVGDGTATAVGTRLDNGDTMTVRWTRDMADRAGLLGKSNWKKYEESMLWARAVSQLCRMLFADCFGGGATYTPEELEDTSSGGEPSGAAASSQAHPLSPASPPVEPDVPFGDNYDAPMIPAGADADKPPSAAMLKKLNVLVGKLRPDHLSTLQLWQSMGREPEPSEDGTLHWSPLRDSLTFSEAMQLIDRLERYANDKLAAASA